MAGPCHVATTGHPDPATILSTTDLRSTAASAGVSSPGTGRSAGIGTGATAAASVAPVPDPQGDAVVREALHLRARWVQALTARAAWQLGCRLVSVGVQPGQDAVRLLTLEELRASALRRAVPDEGQRAPILGTRLERCRRGSD
jgi:hypothetical protein